VWVKLVARLGAAEGMGSPQAAIQRAKGIFDAAEVLLVRKQSRHFGTA